MFPSVGSNHLLGQEFCAWGWCQFSLFSPRQMMCFAQHREDRFFLNVLLNLWAIISESHGSRGTGCVVYNWKCTCFPSRSLWASSWLYHCPGHQFSALSTCSWLFLTNGNIFVHSFPAGTCLPELDSSAMGSCYCTHHPGVIPNTPHHSFQEAFFLSHVLCFLAQVFVVSLSPTS